MQVIAIANHGKLTDHATCLASLAGALTADGFKVLIIEANAQAPISGYFRYSEAAGPSLADIFQDCGIVSKDLFTDLPPVSENPLINLIVAGKELEEIANSLAGFSGKGLLISELVTVIDGLYDYVLVSCSAHLDVLLVNALAASTTLVIPVNLDNLDTEMLKQYLQVVTRVEAGKKASLKKLAAPIANTAEIIAPDEVMAELQSLFGEQLWDGTIPADPHFEQAAAQGVSISELNPKAPGAIGYRRLSEALA